MGHQSWIRRAVVVVLCALTGAWTISSGSSGAADRFGEETEVIRLKVGQELVGRIAEFDEARGVRLKLAIDDALVDVQWDQMHPADVRRIRGAQGFLPDEPEPVFVEATRVVLTTGAEMVGRVVESGEETFVLIDAKGPKTVRRASVRSRENLQVNALEVYEGEELYAEKLYEAEPETALDHYNLALYAESLMLWNRVKEHLDQVASLEPALKTEIVAGKQKRAELRLGAAEEAKVLAQANQLANTRHFEEALARIEKFLDEKPQSVLAGEFKKDEAKIRNTRLKYLKEQVAVDFFAIIDRIANKLALDTSISIQEARKQMQQEATKTALETLAKRVGAEPAEIQAIWEDEDRMRGSVHSYSYGGGTFTLGAERALQGFEKEGDDAKKKDGETGKTQGGAEPSSLEERIKKLMEDRKKEQEKREKEGPRAKKKNQAQIYDVPPTPEEWWGGISTGSERKSYLLAFWAETETHVRKVGVQPRKCVRCVGEGLLEAVTEKGETQVPCERCKGLRVDRLVKVQ